MASHWRVWFDRGLSALSGTFSAMTKPSWKIRRRYIFAAFSLGAAMLLGGTIATLMGTGVDVSDLITAGAALVTLVLTTYVFGSVWEDRAYKEDNSDW